MTTHGPLAQLASYVLDLGPPVQASIGAVSTSWSWFVVFEVPAGEDATFYYDAPDADLKKLLTGKQSAATANFANIPVTTTSDTYLLDGTLKTESDHPVVAYRIRRLGSAGSPSRKVEWLQIAYDDTVEIEDAVITDAGTSGDIWTLDLHGDTVTYEVQALDDGSDVAAGLDSAASASSDPGFQGFAFSTPGFTNELRCTSQTAGRQLFDFTGPYITTDGSGTVTDFNIVDPPPVSGLDGLGIKTFNPTPIGAWIEGEEVRFSDG